MENGTKSINLREIHYPVYRIGSIKPHKIGNTYLYISTDTEGNNIVRVVDDRDIQGATLAERRLALLKSSVKLKKLSNAIFFIGDLIKLAKHGTWFIDSHGELFTHVKQKRASLIFRRIVHKIPIETGGFIIEVEGLLTRFKCLYGPKPTELYAGILKDGKSYILYGFYETKHDDTWRLI